jgi:nucleoside-diphosphate-sugar epimerase
MKVFVTGGSGFVGSVLIPELLSHGHTVLALARSDASAEKLKAFDPSIEIQIGNLEDHDALRAGATAADAVIHLAFIHDFTMYDKSQEIDREAQLAMLEAIKGTNKTYINTSGTLGVVSKTEGVAANEEDGAPDDAFSGRMGTEKVVRDYAAKGIRSMTIRLSPSVHGEGDKGGFATWLCRVAKETGESGYLGDGHQHWSAVHRLDAAKLYRLALEKGEAGKMYHGIAEPGVSVKEIAEVIGKTLGLPVVSLTAEEAAKRYQFLSMVMGLDRPVSGEWTKKTLGWEPTQPTLLKDIEENYLKTA